MKYTPMNLKVKNTKSHKIGLYYLKRVVKKITIDC